MSAGNNRSSWSDEIGEAVLPLELSIIVIVLEGGGALHRCLENLFKQASPPEVEIIIPCDERVKDLGGLRQTFPNINFIAVEGTRTYAELRSIGVAQGRGKIIAVTEDQCRHHRDWVKEILKGHKKACAAVGGAVEKDLPDKMVSWSFFFIDYVRYMNPMLAGATQHLTDCNVSYKRSALAEIRDVWKTEFHEPEVHRALEEKGHILWFSPSMVVYQRREILFGAAIKDRFNFGRLFGSGRARDFSMGARFLYGAVALCLPPLTVGRVAANVFHKKRHFLEFFRALPIIILFNTVWAVGECVGYLTGTPPPALSPASRPANMAKNLP